MAEQEPAEEIEAPKRLMWAPTGVPNLDFVLGGGLPHGGFVLILGAPGSGKTTLASQIAFAAARNGTTVLLLTALSEPTSKLLAHLATFDFFDQALVGGPIQVLSLQQVMSQGPQAVSEEVRAMVRQYKAGLVLLDGFRGMSGIEEDTLGARELLYTLGTALSTRGTTLLVTSETDPRDPRFFPETTTADVILGLHYNLTGVRHQRGVEVVKARGSAPLPGLHALTLGREGASVYPQLEERVAAALLGGDAQTQGAAGPAALDGRPGAIHPLGRAGFGMPELEALLQGGVPRVTSTVVAGSLGIGKTILGLHFALEGVRLGEPVVYLSLRETMEELRQALQPFASGGEFEAALQKNGGLTVLEVPPIKVNPDVIADRLLEALDTTHAQRLVIDSIAELERALVRSGDPSRIEEYLAALTRALRLRGITSLLIKETPKVLAPVLDFSTDRLSVLAENVLLLQQVPFQGQIYRLLSVLKMRYSAHETALREFRIAAPGGFEVLGLQDSTVGVLAGITALQTDQQHQSGFPRRAASSGGLSGPLEDTNEPG